MSVPQQPGPAIVVPVSLPPRHALGLPAGSIRAILALFVVGLICALTLIPSPDPEHPRPLPAYLLYLLFMVLGHYFAAHGNTIHGRGQGGPSPLHLPPGVVRFIIVAGLMATFTWARLNNPEVLKKQLQASVATMQDYPFLPLVILGGFLVGVVVRTIVGRKNPPYWWQDIEAWFALIAILLFCIALIIHLIIDPSLVANGREPLNLPNWEGFLAGIVAFYFGARS
jgi:hypothetical protein